MSINELKELCEELHKERETLERLKQALDACQLSGHQHGITLNISGVGSIVLTYSDRSTGWGERLIRGNEITMLGVKKALGARVDMQSKVVARLENQIAEARVTP
ncbi:hypothetical protein DBR00_11590 [Pseudomonas sp. HMWF032]|uniref:hypothetical protein n=1 Tax=Pseudomonas sp. HMWF032 TaxID=2056866 RepID=UPI000D3331F0|nr:hypothetical protein [Pseudomonas sp. HMWF032]PTS84015.1 hypothetical protein DBR00_11590 [Pseudomonas sp. HMWF032]PTT85370.1 hypothetical protein DBR41_04175 [Pseudomonas sp. HMWF010]